jgi:hypothetical protein
MRNTARNKAEFLKNYAKQLCNITKTCKVVGIDRITFYRWYENDAKFHQAVDDLENVRLDFAEDMLNIKMQQGDSTAIIFFLKTKGKHRGYVEKVIQDVNVRTEQPLFGDYDESKEC